VPKVSTGTTKINDSLIFELTLTRMQDWKNEPLTLTVVVLLWPMKQHVHTMYLSLPTISTGTKINDSLIFERVGAYR
jgi:hypothetical protein